LEESNNHSEKEAKSLIKEKDEKIVNLTSQIKEKDKEIENLQKALENSQELIVNIHQSLPLRLFAKYDRTIGKTIPIKLKKNLKLKKQIDYDSAEIQKSLKTKPKKNDILCFPIINWDYRDQRPHHILRKFASSGHRVFYFTVTLQPIKKPYSITPLENNIFQIELNCPKYFDIFKDEFDEKLTSQLIENIRFIRSEIPLDGVSFVMFPTWEPLVLKLREAFDFKIIYDCVDDVSSFSNVNKKRKKENEILVKNCDLVIASSSKLYDSLSKSAKKSIFIPNAGDFDHFKTSSTHLLNDYKKPIIGYFGAIAEWFDTMLVEHIAKKRPDLTFIFLGDTYGSNLTSIRKLHNVSFLGERPYSELPKYLHSFDVCIIPFKLTSLVLASHPIKIYEFLAAGKPVVTTKIPDLVELSDICYVAEDKEDFLEKLDLALKNKEDDKMIEKRIEFAANNTWQNRFDTLYKELNKIPVLNFG